MLGPGLLRNLPLFPHGKRRTPATSQSGEAQLSDNRLRRQALRCCQSLEAPPSLIFIDGERLGDAEVSKGKAGLLLHKRYLCNRRPTHPGHDTRQIIRRHVEPCLTPVGSISLYHRLQEEGSARGRTYQLNLRTLTPGFGKSLGAGRTGGGIVGEVEPDHVAIAPVLSAEL